MASTGNIIWCVIVLIILIGVGFYIFKLNHHTEKPEQSKSKNITIKNSTSRLQSISTPYGDIELKPQTSKRLLVKVGDIINTHDFVYYIDSTSSDLILTDRGFQSTSSISHNVSFVNNSYKHLHFISDKKIDIQPYSTIIIPDIFRRVLYIIRDPSTNTSITFMTLRPITKIIYDGDQLKSF
jgi:hypothetical protein